MPQTTPNSSAPDFSDFYARHEFQAKKDNDSTRPDGNDWNSPEHKAHQARFNIHHDVLKSAVKKYVTALRDADLFTPVEFTDRRGHKWADAWNGFIEHVPAEKKPWSLGRIADPIQSALMLSTRINASEDGYDHLVKKANEGRFEYWEFTDAISECDVTGQRLAIDIQAGWKPRLGTLDHSLRQSVFSPLAEDAPLPCVKMCQIPAPTGEMLIGNWFHFENNLFTSIVDDGKPEDGLETSAGCAAMTEHYAGKFGFMSIDVGDRGPSIVKRQDHLVIGALNPDDGFDEEGNKIPRMLQGEVKGSVGSDLWCASMIDRSVLVDLLATQIPREQAEQDVAACIKEHNLTTVHVPAGTVYFYYTADKDDLAKFSCENPLEVNRDAVEESYVVISSQPLVWEPMLEPGKAQAPRP